MNTKSIKIRKLIEIRKLRFLIFLFSIFYFLFSAVFAAFEDIGTGARPVGMGNAFTALADDVHAIYYNPAGLGKITRTEVTSGYGRLYWGLDDDSNLGNGAIGCVHPLGKLGAVGLGYSNFALAGDYAENTFLLSYGRNIWGPIYSGINLKILQKVVGKEIYGQVLSDPALNYGDGYTKTGYSIDFGSLFAVSQKVSLAFSMKDINQPDMIYHKTDQVQNSKVPYGLKTGVAYQEDTLNIAVDADFKKSIAQEGTDIKVYTGAEKWFAKYTFALRSGLGLGSREFKNLSVGTSYKTGIFRIDYAFIYPLSGIEETYGTHRFSLTLMFGSSKEEIRKEVIMKSLEERIKSAELLLEKAHQEAENARNEAEKAKKEAEKTSDKIEKLESEQRLEKQMETARKIHELAVEKEKQQNYNYWYLMGERYVEFGDWENASTAYNKALEYKPGDRKTINELEYLQKEIKKRRPGEVQPAKERVKFYTIREDDALPAIAEKVYGDSSRWKEIYEANKDKIIEGKPQPGQVLIIP